MVAFVGRNARNGGAQLAPGLPVRAGQVVAGKYRIEELLGCGAAAIVVGARHVHLRRPVTLKILPPATDLRKARVAARLRGPHVARILDIGTTEDGAPYIVTERIEGHTLAAELERRGRVPFDEAVRWALEACEGLAEAHALGLVHGDLKTSNVFLAGGEEQRTIKVLDFGMASPIEAAGDASETAWLSSPAYLAPEQIRDASSVDARADLWAIGILLHEAIAGQRPFVADTVSGVLVSVCFDTPPLLTEAPYELARLVHRCLEKDPANRPADVEELARALAPFAGASGTTACERVSVALSAAPPSSHPDPDETGSIAPVSMPHPDVRALDRPTAPSLRVLADRRRRRARWMMAGGVAVAAVTVGAFVTPSLPGAAPSLDGEAVAASRPTFEPPAFVPPSFDASRVAAAPPPSRGSSVHASGGRMPTRLPPGLPSTREPAVTAGRAAPRRDHEPSRRTAQSPVLPPGRTDDSWRALFSERK